MISAIQEPSEFEMPNPESYLITLNLSGHEVAYPYARVEEAYSFPRRVQRLALLIFAMTRALSLIAPELTHPFRMLNDAIGLLCGSIFVVLIWLCRDPHISESRVS